MVIAICGYTGQGVETAGAILSEVLRANGRRFRTWRDFSTIIRGGLTSFEAYVDEDTGGEAPARLHAVDVAVVWDRQAAERYRDRVRHVTGLYGAATVDGVPNANRDVLDPVGFNLWALGVVACKLGLSPEDVQAAAMAHFHQRVNLEPLHRGYAKAAGSTSSGPVQASDAPDTAILSGNDALCLGAIHGGVRIYCGYPITPASEILEYMAAWLPEVGGRAYQVEDEIAAIHMAIGASYAGMRTFVATSGPGIDLMTEGLGYAATIEVPLVVVDNQRGGPSTGMPTKTEQSDLRHLLYAGHWEFPRIVLAPTGVVDCLAVIQEALNLADLHQCPVLVALDLDLALRRISVPWETVNDALMRVPALRGRTVLPPASVHGYRRFAAEDGGLPWRTVPGVRGGGYVASGDEHDERGWMEPDFQSVRPTLHRRRLEKVHCVRYDRPLTPVGSPEAPVCLVGTGAMGELIHAAVAAHPDLYRGVLLRQLWPVPADGLLAAVAGAREVVVCEYNATGQLAHLLATTVPDGGCRTVRRYDGEHYTVEAFLAALEAAGETLHGRVRG
ncbi:2-oxoacid:acceptor oxidoreductase family protein [Alicyclobacillus macrosporangiidus]|uniref:2-oxoglutarate ferredoxin oxidoreductase subunit alpha n=1 Tax=Alicyclobacillus macrosporangiidus TaxID=392015 RepID=A0A1I7K7I2_9BACL|nr:2-oxoacid:acceptor oxidoreductase family protein [Alicyclobacillus macrosporangiidus]SFU93395.1 2-oxoglutarate ferredoxin oxidoreductase subunit alpha [Alicyclobacillus macrosporangiidus]